MLTAFLAALKTGTLPAVSFVDPTGSQDEHPTNEVHGGEAWTQEIFSAAVGSPLWQELAVVFMAHSPGPTRWHYRQVINALVYDAIED